MISHSLDLNHILAMGGYGAYVWSAYAITFIVFGLNVVASYREQRRVKKTVMQSFMNASQSQ